MTEFLSQEPWELLGGVSTDYFMRSHRESAGEQVQLKKVNLGEVLGLLNEDQVSAFERETVISICELHPMLSSIGSTRLIKQEGVVGGMPVTYFQTEGHLNYEPGVATVIFNPNPSDELDRIRYESDFGDPEQIDQRGEKYVSLREAYENYPEGAQKELEDLMVRAFLQGANPDARFIRFEGSEKSSGIFMGQDERGALYIVMQHPALVDDQQGLVRAVVTFTQDEQGTDLKVDHETKFVERV